MRRALALALVFVALPVFAGAPRPLAEGRELLAAGQLDELYLAHAAAAPGGHPEGDEALAALLVDGAEAALAQSDAALALGLAETARRLQPRSVPAMLAFAAAARTLKQPGAAAEALEAALLEAPRDGEVIFRRAELARDEGDLERALSLFGAVSSEHPRHREAEAAQAEVRERLQTRRDELARVALIEKKLLERQLRAGGEGAEMDGTGEAVEAAGARGGTVRGGVVRGRPDEGDDVAAGFTARRSDHFRILYARGERDFAQKAEYEGRILGMLEKIYAKVGQTLGHRPERTFDVVLYTREEFALHFGDGFAQSIAGFYQGKIRMNFSEEPNDRFYRVLVHEYTHAVVDDLSQGRSIPMWLHEGLAEWTEWEVGGDGDRQVVGAIMLGGARRQGRSLPLTSLESVSFGSLGNARPAYMKSRAAVQALVGTGSGVGKLRDVLRAVATGIPFRAAFDEAFGENRYERLDEEANALLAR